MRFVFLAQSWSSGWKGNEEARFLLDTHSGRINTLNRVCWKATERLSFLRRGSNEAGSAPFSVSDYFWQQAERAELSPKNAYDQWRATIGRRLTREQPTTEVHDVGHGSIHDSTVNCLRSGWPVAASKVLLKVSPPKNRHVRTEQLLEIHRSLARRPPWLLQDPRPGPLEGSRLRTDRTRRDPFVVSSVSERCFNRDFFSRSPVLLHTLKVSPEIVMFRVRPFLLVTRTSK